MKDGTIKNGWNSTNANYVRDWGTYLGIHLENICLFNALINGPNKDTKTLHYKELGDRRVRGPLKLFK